MQVAAQSAPFLFTGHHQPPLRVAQLIDETGGVHRSADLVGQGLEQLPVDRAERPAAPAQLADVASVRRQRQAAARRTLAPAGAQDPTAGVADLCVGEAQALDHLVVSASSRATESAESASRRPVSAKTVAGAAQRPYVTWLTSPAPSLAAERRPRRPRPSQRPAATSRPGPAASLPRRPRPWRTHRPARRTAPRR